MRFKDAENIVFVGHSFSQLRLAKSGIDDGRCRFLPTNDELKQLLLIVVKFLLQMLIFSTSEHDQAAF